MWRWQRRSAPYLFLLPFAALFCTFAAYPLARSFQLAFYQSAGPRSFVYVGIDNFRYLFEDELFWKAVLNTTIYALFSVFLQLPLSLGLALLLSAKWVRLRNIFRLAFFSPHLVGQVFVAVLFTQLYAPKYGLVNRAVRAVHSGLRDLLSLGPLEEIQWLQDPALVMPALILTALWMYVGFNMIYFLAALQAVDRDLYEAASVDGANAWQQFWHVTLPSIKPVAVFVVVMSTIGSYQLFELPYVLLGGGGGPKNSGLTIVMYLFNQGFETGDLGYASAIGWALMLIILVISLVQLRLTGTFRREG